jgi:hypothetical protein
MESSRLLQAILTRRLSPPGIRKSHHRDLLQAFRVCAVSELGSPARHPPREDRECPSSGGMEDHRRLPQQGQQ